MEHNFKDGFNRRSEDRRDYGSSKFGNDESKGTPRPRRPRIGKTQPRAERVDRFYSSDEGRRFVPAGEQTMSFSSPGCLPVSSTILALPRTACAAKVYAC